MDENQKMSDSSNSQPPCYFPYDLSNVPFPRQSDEKYIQTNNKEAIPNIVLGSFDGDTEFCEVLLSKDTIEPGYIKWKSLNKDHNKSNADLKKISFDDAEDVNSFLIDNKYMFIQNKTQYNVYDMIDDEWLLKENDSFYSQVYTSYDAREKESILLWYEARSVVINDQFYIISLHNNVYFFPVWNYYRIIDLDVLEKYSLTTKDSYFAAHGMCCIDFEYKSTTNGKNIVHDLRFKLLLFGGTKQFKRDFFSTFLTLDIKMEFKTDSNYKLCKDMYDGFQLSKFIVTESKSNLEANEYRMRNWSHFAYHCILNGKCEPIIVIVGGTYDDCSSVCLYNTITQEICVKSQVEFVVLIIYLIN